MININTQPALKTLKTSSGIINRLINALIKFWDEAPSMPGKEFRVEERVLEEHWLESMRQPEWRVPYGVDGSEAYQLTREIKHRREQHLSLEGLAWTPNDDPYAPANDPNHPYYLGRRVCLLWGK